jgi:colicin import membrane protein
MRDGIIQYNTENAIALTQQAKALRENAEITIDSQISLDQATAFLRGVKSLAKQIEDERVSITKPINDALKAINDLFREPKAILDDAERKVKGAITAYQAEQRRIADEAAKKALAEKLAIEAEARKAQEEAEAARKAAEATGDKEAIEAAEIAEREAIILKGVSVTIDTTPIAPQKAEGTQERTNYKASVVDIKALCKAIAEGRAPIECVEPNTPFLNTQARALRKGNGEYIYDGVQSVVSVTLAVR